jgi:hypothetical protein
VVVETSEAVPNTLYLRYGDWYALCFAVVVLGLAGFGMREKWQGRGV